MKNKNHQHRYATQETVRDKKSPFGFLKNRCRALCGKCSPGGHGFSDFLFRNLFTILFFFTVWALLVFYEEGLLFRVSELSVFLDDDLYYREMMSAPAGFLSYIACYLVQFFHKPLLGATIYVALLVLVYWLTYKVFDISRKYKVWALVPVVALLASNTQLGYWIFYLKVPGYYYVALLGVIISLSVAWCVKKSHTYLKPLLVAAWIYFAYPYFGVYAIVSGVIIGIHALCMAIGRDRSWQKILISSVTFVVSIVMFYYTPGKYYTEYTTVPRDEMSTAGLPASQWKGDHIPDDDEKESIVSIIRGVNGKVGYPVDKELTKFKMNVDASFSDKAIKTAKDGLFASVDINRPADGKRYTFTFVGKGGREYYLNRTGETLSFVPRNGEIPKTGYFVCEADKDIKQLAVFKTLDGKYLVWNVKEEAGEMRYSVELAASKTAGNSRCSVMKIKKEKGVHVSDDSELFGLTCLLVFGNGAVDENFAPLFVAGFADGVLKGADMALFNDTYTSALRIEEVGFKPAPFSLAMSDRSMWYNVNIYWLPFWLLFAVFVVMAVPPAFPLHMPAFVERLEWGSFAVSILVALLLAGFSYLFWYDNENFRIENNQNKAMWEEDWERVAELAKEADVPTRQVVMNKNIALLKLGRSGDELFAYPEGSSDIEAPMPVRLAQTGGKMAYFQYGKFNFCYRWCVEDAVEYGWRVEYLKHAVRSMLLAGEYRLAERYIKILKRTRYYADWASDMEKYVRDPQLLQSAPEFEVPLAMSCYADALDVDESYVEAYLTKNLTNASEEMSRVYVDAALASALTRKDSRAFWSFLNYYVNTFCVDELSTKKLPVHYQEAVLLFLNLDKGKTVQVPQAFLDRFVSKKTETRMRSFMARVSKHKGKSEVEMAPYFKDDFGNTYFYFYFFVRNIKTN